MLTMLPLSPVRPWASSCSSTSRMVGSCGKGMARGDELARNQHGAIRQALALGRAHAPTTARAAGVEGRQLAQHAVDRSDARVLARDPQAHVGGGAWSVCPQE